jgi:hypothetical protein
MTLLRSLRLRSVLAVFLSFALVATFVLASSRLFADDPKCPVCDNKKKPKTIFVSCKDLSKYLSHHPGATSGACGTVSNEKPPKPTPTPKSSPTPKPTPKPKTLAPASVPQNPEQ